ncbi:MAG: hypothetical protein QOG73_4000 [Acetobacteraceae bacterium]|nr:hypothetical protein [Acetobacteraceae bacterium]
MDTMTASGTRLLQFSQHGAGLESRPHIHENTILSVRESQLQGAGLRRQLVERHADYHFVPSADTAHER